MAAIRALVSNVRKALTKSKEGQKIRVQHDPNDQISPVIPPSKTEDSGDIQKPPPPASTSDGKETAKNASEPVVDKKVSQSLVQFQALVDRSIAAWRTINYVGAEKHDDFAKELMMEREINRLRKHTCLDELLKSKAYWFFQRRESFMQQKSTFMKWDRSKLDEYVLLPIQYGFVNKRDCFFVSHYWHTKDHPDPKGVDLVQVKQDLAGVEWSYVWVDWSCVPQVPRTEIEEEYFNRSLHFIHMLVRNCGFEWRFPKFEPRGWILYEVAEYALNQNSFTWTDDNRPFIEHATQMISEGVRPVMERHGYRCSRHEDLTLVIGWLELAILLVKLFRDDIKTRRWIWDMLDKPEIGELTVYSPEINIDMVRGTVKYQGRTHQFTPTWRFNLSR